jgi:hypothetical protein
MSDPLTQLQQDVTMLLKSEPFFAEIPVLSRAQGVTSAEIDARLGGKGLYENSEGKIGCCVVVMMPIADAPNADPSGPALSIVLPVTVYEKPKINREDGGIGETAEEIALQVLAAVHHRGVAFGIGELHADQRALDPLSVEDESVVAYQVYFVTRFTLAARPQVKTPLIAGNAAAVQLSCQTPGAEIYYTTDGSYPAPTSVNPAATFFGSVLETESGLVITTEAGNPLTVALPFALEPGETLRAAAYKPATHQGSNVATSTF